MNNTTNTTIEEKKAFKKSFEQLKKKLFAGNDPLGLKGCMYMTNQQMDKRTATIDLGYAGNAEGVEACSEKAGKIVNTDAFDKFSNEIGAKTIAYEIKENAYYHKHMYMRINY